MNNGLTYYKGKQNTPMIEVYTPTMGVLEMPILLMTQLTEDISPKLR